MLNSGHEIEKNISTKTEKNNKIKIRFRKIDNSIQNNQQIHLFCMSCLLT